MSEHVSFTPPGLVNRMLDLLAEGEGPSIYLTDPEGNVVELKGPPAKK